MYVNRLQNVVVRIPILSSSYYAHVCTWIGRLQSSRVQILEKLIDYFV